MDSNRVANFTNGFLWVVVSIIALMLSVVTAKLVTVQRHQNDAIRSIMCFAESYVERNPRATQEQRQEATVFYKKALTDAGLQPCALSKPPVDTTITGRGRK